MSEPSSSLPFASFFASLPTSFSVRLVAAPLALAAVAACNEPETGRRGVVEFVPDDCGELSCDLDDRLAVGGTTDVYLNGINGAYVDDLELVSDAPVVFDILGRESSAFPRFTLLGNAPGRADLVAIDRDGYEVDYISVSVVRIDALAFDVAGDAVRGPDSIITVDGSRVDRYTIAPGSRVEIDVDALADGYPVMGSFQYGVVLDPPTLAALTSRSDVARGFLELTAPAGEHDLIVTAPGGAYRTIRLSVQ